LKKPVSYVQLYRFASKSDYALMSLSFIGAVGNGLTMPIYSVLFGNVTDSYAFDDDQTKLEKAGFNTL
jgi:ATP-binding cassette subfamily B (MDR/TAP) protein 1